MSLISSPGLVLRRTRHLENDVRLTLLLREVGKVLVVARGGRRPTSKLKAIQEPFTDADFQIFLPVHSVYARLTGGKLLNTHHHLRQNVAAFETASKCCEVVDLLVPFRAPSADVYDILRHALRSFRTASADLCWLWFVVRLLQCLGHGDAREELFDLVAAQDRDALKGALNDGAAAPLPPTAPEPSVSEKSMALSRRFVQERLEKILPWPLKSETTTIGRP